MLYAHKICDYGVLTVSKLGDNHIRMVVNVLQELVFKINICAQEYKIAPVLPTFWITYMYMYMDY